MAISSKYSSQTGAAPQGVSVNDNRRIYNFGERVAELAPQQSPFFVYLNKVGRKPTDDPVFKFLEQRHQWQRRNFKMESAVAATAPSGGALSLSNIKIMAMYDKYGRATTVGQPANYILDEGDSVGQMIQIAGTFEKTADATDTDIVAGTLTLRVTNVDSHTAASGATDGYTQLDVDVIAFNNVPLNATDHPDAGEFVIADGSLGQVIGSAHPEGGKAPDGWEDSLYDREGYTQIFKTAMKLFSGTAMATRYRGYADEYKRIWKEKLMEHKMDLEHAMLFGVGGSDESSAGPIRKTHGILPYTMQHGTTMDFDYSYFNL